MRTKYTEHLFYCQTPGWAVTLRNMRQLVKLRTWSAVLTAAALAACGSPTPASPTLAPTPTAGSTPSQAALPDEAISDPGTG
jgi:hypothetical protein